MVRAPKPFISLRPRTCIVRIGVGLSALVCLTAILVLIYERRNREHSAECKRLYFQCECAELLHEVGLNSHELKYNADGTSEYLESGWRHVEPPLHWNDGHPNKVWTDWTGEERVYDPDGVLRRTSLLMHSRKNGLSRHWDEKGHLVARGNFIDGTPIGKWLVWDQSVIPYVVEW
jgi:hypothetical protein